MVAPLLLGVLAGGAGLSLLGNQASDAVTDIAADVVEESFAVMGTGIVAGGTGFVRAIKKEAQGHGVEITATLTVMAISYFYFKRYIQ